MGMNIESDSEDLAKRADVGIGICIARTRNDFSYRPLPTFIDVAYGPSILHGFVEVAEMSQVDAQAGKRVLFEYLCPEIGSARSSYSVFGPKLRLV